MKIERWEIDRLDEVVQQVVDIMKTKTTTQGGSSIKFSIILLNLIQMVI